MAGRVGFGGWLVAAAFLRACAFGAIITVKFAGPITGSSIANLPAGSLVTGCFTYDSNVTDRLQSKGRTILAISIPQENFRLEREFYRFGVYDNWSSGAGEAATDGLTVDFVYPQGYAVLSVATHDITMFAGENLPTRLPLFERFELGGSLYITVDEVQNYRTAVMRIDHFYELLTAPPLPRLAWHVAGEEIQFQFSGEAASNYMVEATDSLASPNWESICEVAGIAGGFTVTREAGYRFFRVRQVPCPCL